MTGGNDVNLPTHLSISFQKPLWELLHLATSKPWSWL